jgi:hypothetical protein
MAKKPKAGATQDFVPIEDIRDGVAVLDDGTLIVVLLASSINLALKSEDEQTSVFLQFQNLLNSLDFPIQFLVQSRELDTRPYLALLEEVEREQTNDLLKIQTREYIEFIKTFTASTSIMTKSFFVIVPYTPSIASQAGGLKGLVPLGPLAKKGEEGEAQSEERFQEYRSQLEQRVAIVEQGIARTGVRTVQLGTEEMIELFYRTFNPGELHKPASTK